MPPVSSASFGTPAMQGPIQPGATPLPGATAGLFGSGGQFGMAQTLSTTSALSAGFGAYTTISAGKMAADQFRIQSGSEDLASDVVRLNAVEKGNVLKKQLLRDIGAANASAAARGIDVGSGTPRQIVQQSIAETREVVADIESGAGISAAGLQTSASRTRATAATREYAGYVSAAQGLGSFALGRL